MSTALAFSIAGVITVWGITLLLWFLCQLITWLEEEFESNVLGFLALTVVGAIFGILCWAATLPN